MIPESTRSVRWLIRPVGDLLPEPVFLHVFDDGEAEAEMDFLPDRTRALRFASAEAAARFARLHRLAGVGIVGFCVSLLVGPGQHPFDRAAAVA